MYTCFYRTSCEVLTNYPQAIASPIWCEKKKIIIIFSAALDVNLKEESFPEQDFEVVKGNLNVKWERIAPYPLKQFYKKNASCTLIALVNYQFCLNQGEYEINERIS